MKYKTMFCFHPQEAEDSISLTWTSVCTPHFKSRSQVVNISLVVFSQGLQIGQGAASLVNPAFFKHFVQLS
jgi:hypothetical protein